MADRRVEAQDSGEVWGRGDLRFGGKNLDGGKPVSGAGDLWVFAGVMVLGQFSPGPDMLLLTRTALREGAGAGVRMAMGVACGLCLHATVALGGLAVVFQSLPVFRGFLRWGAAIYLLWLAWGMAKDVIGKRHGLLQTDERESGARRSHFVRGFLCNLLNPKVALFLAAVCAPFLRGHRPPWWPVAMGGIVVGLAITLWSAWVMLLQWPPLRIRYERSAVWLDGLFSLVLTALAVSLLIGG